jgi:hypothetical protein
VKARSALIDARFLGPFDSIAFSSESFWRIESLPACEIKLSWVLVFKILIRKHNGFTNVCNCFEILQTSVGEIAICGRLLMVSLVFARAVSSTPEN